MHLPLVGLIGRARSGKDTLADVLVARLGYTKAAMADPLREMAAAIDPVVDVAAEGTDDGHALVHFIHYTEAIDTHGYEAAKDAHPELRRFLQRLGTEGIRDHVGKDVWVRAAERTIAAANTPLVFTDIRFSNEADMIRRNGGVLVGIHRYDYRDPGDAHPSEDLDAIIDTADFVLYNTDTLDHYIQECHVAADAIRALST